MINLKYSEILKIIREENPLVLNLTNQVAANFSANALLAIGASPIMTQAEEEIEELVAVSRALVLNIGTLDKAQVNLMKKALCVAKERNLPVVLDPVGVHATDYRLLSARELLTDGGITVLRGNAAEIMALAGQTGAGQGVDSSVDTHIALPAAEWLLNNYRVVIAISGAVDWVVTQKEQWSHSGGHSMMPKITGMGCVTSALLGAFLAVEKEIDWAVKAMWIVVGKAGEAAARKAKGPGSFIEHFLDELYVG